jgi:hypothetical protein
LVEHRECEANLRHDDSTSPRRHHAIPT